MLLPLLQALLKPSEPRSDIHGAGENETGIQLLDEVDEVEQRRVEFPFTLHRRRRSFRDFAGETINDRIVQAYPTIPRSYDNKDVMILPLPYRKNRGMSGRFRTYSGR